MSERHSKLCADCGKKITARAKQCGSCAQRVASPVKRSPLYRIWCGMLTRCRNPASPDYPGYGARGINVCEEWQRCFHAFASWAMTAGWRSGLTIDRIDNDGPYSPDNCRWATWRQQSRNRKNNRILTAFGESKCVVEWSEDSRCAVSRKTLKDRIRNGWPLEEALRTPWMSPSERGRRGGAGNKIIRQ